MSSSSFDFKAVRKKPSQERRASRGKPGSVRWMKGLLGRPLGMEKRDDKLHVTLVERRRSPEQWEAEVIQNLCAELSGRVLAHEHAHAAATMRHLVAVHDTLLNKGWSAVQALPSGVIAKALLQAQMLNSQESSSALSYLIDRLRLLQVAAELREERLGASSTDSTHGAVEVSEVSQAEYENSQGEWVATVSEARLAPEEQR
jgi:hypothetical protein